MDTNQMIESLKAHRDAGRITADEYARQMGDVTSAALVAGRCTHGVLLSHMGCADCIDQE